MDVKIINLHNQGTYKTEYIWLRASKDCNLSKFALTDCTYTEDGELSNKWEHVYWFPDWSVSAGDYISLRTRPGKDETHTDSDGKTIHRLYWGLNVSVWNNDDDAAMLMHISDFSIVRSK